MFESLKAKFLLSIDHIIFFGFPSDTPNRISDV